MDIEELIDVYGFDEDLAKVVSEELPEMPDYIMRDLCSKIQDWGLSRFRDGVSAGRG